MKKELLLSASAIALMVGCSDTVVNSYDEAKAKAKITVSVLDGSSNEAIDSAAVKAQFENESSYTDENGFAIYNKNDIGSYVFDISKKGYSTTRATVSVVEMGANDVSRVPDVVLTVPLYKADVTVKGKVYYRDRTTGNLIPADSVKVVLSYAGSTKPTETESASSLKKSESGSAAEEPTFIIYPSEVFAVTNDKGEYEFTNVAEMVNFYIDVLQSKIDSKYYRSAGYVSASGARAGSIKNMEEITMVADGEIPKLLNSNLDAIDDSVDLEFGFSTELDQDSVDGFWTVKKAGSKVLTTASLSKDKKVITISPLSDSWSHGDSYSVEGVVYSKDGVRITVSKTFSVGSVAIPKHVSNPKVKLDESRYDEDYPASYNFRINGYLKLTWTPNTKDVSGYNIYYQTNVMDDFIFFAETADDSSYSRSINSLAFINDTTVKKVDFIILPYNGAGEPSVSKAKKVTWTIPEIKDEDEEEEEGEDEEEE
ncbi:MAG: hypothetical protein J6W22_06685 [Fibrobacter sp.]|nr:hypothetical protein [Fibrobacter sp.]